MILQDVPLEPIKAVGIIIIGFIAAWIVGIIIKKTAKSFIYPGVRKNSPESYKNTVSGVNLTTQIVQWAIIFVFVFQAIAFFNISLADQVLSKLVIFVPKMITGFLILAVGVILANTLSKKVKEMKFKNSSVIAKTVKYLILFATILSVLEIVEIKVTPFLILFEVLLYFVAISAAIAIGIGLGLAIRPDISKVIKELKKKD